MSLWSELLSLLVVPPVVVALRHFFNRHDPLRERTRPLDFWVMYGLVTAVLVAGMVIRRV